MEKLREDTDARISKLQKFTFSFINSPPDLDSSDALQTAVRLDDITKVLVNGVVLRSPLQTDSHTPTTLTNIDRQTCTERESEG